MRDAEGGVMRASEKAYRALLDDIVNGSLAPGTALAEVEQSARLGVSRTPLREALSQLRKDGLIEQQRGRGLTVTQISLDDIVELYELRQPLEQQAAKLAAQRGDAVVFSQLAVEFRNADNLINSGESGIRSYYALNERLDRAIEDAIDSAYLVAALKSVHLHLARIRRLSRGDIGRLKQAAIETLVIIEAIVDHNPDLAASATQVHMQQSLRNSLEAARSLQVTERVA
jgi:DNA-binding GntR family transcriptional regulator